jgi:hypothetical protein
MQETLMDKALFKDLYLFELDRREKLAQTMDGLITALSIVGGVFAFILDKYTFSMSDSLNVTISVIAIGAGAAYAVSLYHALKHFHLPRDYRAIATSSALWQYYQELTAFFKSASNAKEKADAAFEEYLNRVYSEATDVNANNNYYRGDRQKRAFAALTYAIGLTLLAFVVQYVAARLP